MSTALAPAPARITFGEHIAERRTEIHLSRADLAAACDVSVQTVGYWETDTYLPEAKKLPRLAGTLKISTRTVGAWLDDSPLVVPRGYFDLVAA